MRFRWLVINETVDRVGSIIKTFKRFEQFWLQKEKLVTYPTIWSILRK